MAKESVKEFTADTVSEVDQQRQEWLKQFPEKVKFPNPAGELSFTQPVAANIWHPVAGTKTARYVLTVECPEGILEAESTGG